MIPVVDDVRRMMWKIHYYGLLCWADETERQRQNVDDEQNYKARQGKQRG
jgi:hypothetical protein